MSGQNLSVDPELEEQHSESAPGQRRRQRKKAIAGVIVVALAGGCIALAVPWNAGEVSVQSTSEPAAQTVEVERTDMTDGRALDGTLGYGISRSVKGMGEGTVTWLPPAGKTVTRGKPLYRVDDRPVALFYGAVPLYRELDEINTVGRDVRMLADNLVALGYDIGYQPGPGTIVTVRIPTSEQTSSDAEKTSPSGTAAIASPSDPPSTAPSKTDGTSPDSDGPAKATETRPPAARTGQVRVRNGDGVLTRDLIAAVKRWQSFAGMPDTGVLGPGDLVVLSGAVRVEKSSADVGDAVAAPLLHVTPTAKAVTVEVEATQVGAVRRGDPVTVKLPDNTTATAKVAEIGTVVDAGDQGAAGAQKVNLTVAFVDPTKAKKFDAAQVQVEFASEKRKGVLAVPVTALLALREGGYGLRLTGGQLIAVETGLFSKGMVEVSGQGITAGTRVETAS